MKNIIDISPGFLQKWPKIKLGCIICEVKVEPTPLLLANKMDNLLQSIRSTYDMYEISQLPAIFFARKAYRNLGKDPVRYRLSAESLLRRVTRGDELYRINNVVDIVNMLSLLTGFSIGAYDLDLIEGEITLCSGKINELYDGIGRGWMNIENLPVLRDKKSAFGSPTSDSVRTSVTFNTKKLLMVFFDFGTPDKLMQANKISKELLEGFAYAGNFKQFIINGKEQIDE